MDIVTAIEHLANFFAPAFAVSLILITLGHLFWPGRPQSLRWWSRWLLMSLAGSVVLFLGLWCWGADGKIATYLSLIVVLVVLQSCFLKLWLR